MTTASLEGLNYIGVFWSLGILQFSAFTVYLLIILIISPWSSPNEMTNLSKARQKYSLTQSENRQNTPQLFQEFYCTRCQSKNLSSYSRWLQPLNVIPSQIWKYFRFFYDCCVCSFFCDFSLNSETAVKANAKIKETMRYNNRELRIPDWCMYIQFESTR